ncbi:MAG: DPP IV N-terminal domain-containing protein [Anaerolineae bacterium]|nr:DPP IV N-terminal domain-containing protein [Anaerolineae bacterium]
MASANRMRSVLTAAIICLFLILSGSAAVWSGGYIGSTEVSWSPDGEYLIYYADCVAVDSCTNEVQESGFYLLNTISGDTARLLNADYTGNVTISWSESGEYFAFPLRSHSGLYIGSITRDIADQYEFPTSQWDFTWQGNEVMLVTTAPLETSLNEKVVDIGDGAFLDFSPDQQWVAFSEIEGEDRQLVLLNIKTGERVDLGSFGGEQVHWSPDSRWLAMLPNANDEVELINLEDRHSLVVNTLVPNAFSGYGIWSPDSQSFALWGGADWNIYVVNVETQTVREITAGPAIEGLPPFQITASEIMWSPNSKKIAFSEHIQDDGNSTSGMNPSRLCVVSLETQARLCSPLFELGWREAFSPDSNQLALNGYTDGQNVVYFLLLEDNSVRWYPIVGEDGRQPITFDWSADSEKVAFLPIPAEMPVKVLTMAEILALPEPERILTP